MTDKEILKALGLSKKSCISEQIVQTTHHWLEACDKIAELEKKNAELEEEAKNNEDLATVAYLQGADSQKKKYDKQLAKAESLITRLSTCFGSYANNIFENELLKEAEQFLNEVEK